MKKIIFTSYYANPTRVKRAESISLYPPHWFKVLGNIPELTPSRDLLMRYKNGEVSVEGYIKEFTEQLFSKELNYRYDKLELSLIHIKNKAIMCYEKPSDFCHRFIVSDVLKLRGEIVIEVPNTKIVSVAVIGSRTFKDYDIMKEVLDQLRNMFDMKFVSGGAMGADSLSEKYAKEHELEMTVFLPDYNKHGRSAPFIRNKEIIDNCDLVVSFWDGESNGTRHSMDLARKQGKEVIVYNEKKKDIELYKPTYRYVQRIN